MGLTGLLKLFFWLALEHVVTVLEWSTLLSHLDKIKTWNHCVYRSTGNKHLVLFSVSKANTYKKTMIYNSHSQNPLLHTPNLKKGDDWDLTFDIVPVGPGT